MKKLIAAAALVVAGVSTADATTYRASSTNVNGVDATFQYSDHNDNFSLQFAVDALDGVDGAWWVINDGPMPQGGTKGTHAIFYTDLKDVWAYQYQGGWQNPSSSQGPLLQRWENAVTTSANGGQSVFDLMLDLTAVNGRTDLRPDWKGLAFDTTIGTWLHPTRNAFSDCGTYINGSTGDLDCFKGTNWLGWDQANLAAAEVPLPASFALLAAPLALGFGRKVMKKTA
ncbi:MAG: hypothetical protein AAGD04_07320 [Pseudomonadota bacterium]